MSDVRTEPKRAAADQRPPDPKRAVPPAPAGWRRAVDNPWLMVAMLFFVTAALGLPLLWISRGFSTLAKIVLTVAVLAWTALILWLFWLVMVWCYVRIADALWT
jgi:hypothetical protein